MLQHDDRAPFTDHKDLHRVIDAIPHGDVPWKSIQVQFSGDIPEPSPHWMTKSYDVWFRDPNVVVEALLSNPDFDKHFDYVPYHEFEPMGERRWENFMSGNWAWRHAVSFHWMGNSYCRKLIGKQDILANNPAMHGAMLVPIILGSDKTTVSVATGQNDYYPLYLSIGNVHNNTHRAHRNALILVAFLAIPKSRY